MSLGKAAHHGEHGDTAKKRFAWPAQSFPLRNDWNVLFFRRVAVPAVVKTRISA
jgi:hypothetical protein